MNYNVTWASTEIVQTQGWFHSSAEWEIEFKSSKNLDRYSDPNFESCGTSVSIVCLCEAGWSEEACSHLSCPLKNDSHWHLTQNANFSSFHTIVSQVKCQHLLDPFRDDGWTGSCFTQITTRWSHHEILCLFCAGETFNKAGVCPHNGRRKLKWTNVSPKHQHNNQSYQFYTCRMAPIRNRSKKLQILWKISVTLTTPEKKIKSTCIISPATTTKKTHSTSYRKKLIGLTTFHGSLHSSSRHLTWGQFQRTVHLRNQHKWVKIFIECRQNIWEHVNTTLVSVYRVHCTKERKRTSHPKYFE